MSAEGLQRHIRFSLSSPILSSKSGEIVFSLHFTPLEICQIQDHKKRRTMLPEQFLNDH